MSIVFKGITFFWAFCVILVFILLGIEHTITWEDAINSIGIISLIGMVLASFVWPIKKIGELLFSKNITRKGDVWNAVIACGWCLLLHTFLLVCLWTGIVSDAGMKSSQALHYVVDGLMMSSLLVILATTLTVAYRAGLLEGHHLNALPTYAAATALVAVFIYNDMEVSAMFYLAIAVQVAVSFGRPIFWFNAIMVPGIYFFTRSLWFAYLKMSTIDVVFAEKEPTPYPILHIYETSLDMLWPSLAVLITSFVGLRILQKRIWRRSVDISV